MFTVETYYVMYGIIRDQVGNLYSIDYRYPTCDKMLQALNWYKDRHFTGELRFFKKTVIEDEIQLNEELLLDKTPHKQRKEEILCQ